MAVTREQKIGLVITIANLVVALLSCAKGLFEYNRHSDEE